jgi:hypothetical protein
MEIRTNQPNQPAQPLNERQMQSAGPQVLQTGKRASRFKSHRLVLLLSCLIVLLAIGMFWSWWLFGRNVAFDETKNINRDEFQAVFLTNGQVYFGKLSGLNNKYVTISDIYYLQVQQSTGLQGASNTTTPSSQVSLAKLGSELHGPEDKMYVANGQMLFWENLKNSSKVVQAIDKYQAQK